jgi:hypothetical protein
MTLEGWGVRKSIFAIAGLALALASCGGGESDVGRIEAAMRTEALSHDPAKCERAATQNLLDQASTKSGVEAVEDCEEEAKDKRGDTRSVSVADVQVDGTTATAKTSFRGGSLDGQTISVRFVEEDGRWKLDELTRFIELDRRALSTAIAKTGTEQGEATQARIGCFSRSLAKSALKTVEDLILRNSAPAIIALAKRCPEYRFRGTVTEQIAKSITRFVRSDEPAKCFEEATQGYLEQIYALKGRQALGECTHLSEEAKAQPKPTTVVFNVQATNARATAYLELEGIGLARQVLEVALVRRYGHWVLARRVGLVHIDRERFANATLKGVALAGIDPTPAESACVRATIMGLSKAQFEALAFDLSGRRARRIGERCLAAAKAPPSAA